MPIKVSCGAYGKNTAVITEFKWELADDGFLDYSGMVTPTIKGSTSNTYSAEYNLKNGKGVVIANDTLYYLTNCSLDNVYSFKNCLELPKKYDGPYTLEIRDHIS